MVALEHHHVLPQRIPVRLGLPGLVALTAMAVVLSGILDRGFADNGFRLGSQMGWRFTGIVLFFALTGGPVARLFARTRFAVDDARLTRDLVWSFCASFAIYLLSVLLPNLFANQGIGAGLGLFLITGFCVCAGMAAVADPARLRFLGEASRRTVLGVAAIYFWLCFSLLALAHLYGPHRPDGYYGFSLMMMILALLVRFADRFAANWGAGRPARPAA